MSKPANTAFNGGPSDDLEAVDVYGVRDPERRNNYQSENSAFTDSLNNAFGAAKGYVEQAKDLGQEYKGKAEDWARDQGIDPKQAEQNVRGALKGSKPALDKVGEDVSKVILGDIQEGSMLNVPGSEGNYYKAYKIVEKNLTDGAEDVKKLTNVDPDSAQSVMDMVSDVTGHPLVQGSDLGAHAAVLHGAIEKMAEWGVPELIDDTLKKIKDEDLRREVARRSASKLVRAGNIDMVESAIKNVGASALVAENPRLPQQVLQMYQFKAKTTPEDYPELLTQLVWCMDRLQPNWFWTQRAGQDVWNLATLVRISDDARELLSSDETYRSPAITAQFFPERTTTNLLRTMYPGIALA